MRARVEQKEKLRQSRQFQEIYARGRRLKGPHLAIFCRLNGLPYNRLGLSVSKKRFKLSVRRHYIQRRLREAYRLNKLRFLPGHDIVITAFRFNKGKIRLVDIKSELLSLAGKAGLLKRNVQ